MRAKNLSWAVLAVFCILANGRPGIPGGAPVPARAEALWIAGSDGLLKIAAGGGELLLEIDTPPNVRAVAVDSRRAAVWFYGEGTLFRHGFDGAGHLAVPVQAPSPAEVELTVDPVDGSAWLGIGRDLRGFSAAGDPVRSLRLAAGLRAAAMDPAGGRLWVGTADAATLFDTSTGEPVLSLDLGHNPGLQDLAVDPASGHVWLATRDGLGLFEPQGVRLLALPLPGLLHVAADGRGGAWLATAKALSRVDAAGALLASGNPFDGRGRMVDLAASPDGSAWAANETGVAKVGAAGALLRAVDFQPPIHIRDLALHADATPPTLEIVAPAAGTFLATRTPAVELRYADEGTGADPDSLELRAGGALLAAACSPTAAGASCALATPLTEGAQTLTATIRDFAGNLSPPAEVSFTVDTVEPEIRLEQPVDGAVTPESEQAVAGALNEPATLTLGGTAVAVNADGSFSATVSLQEGPNSFTLVATDRAGNSTSLTFTVTFEVPDPGDDLPPDPATVAPPVDPAVATDFAAATEFLYTGADPVQTGVTPGAIEPRRAAVLRGKVLGRDGEPLAGVRITVLGQPGLGATLSREDGRFDLAVNGGGAAVLQYEKAGLLPAQRRVTPAWRDWLEVEEVVLVPFDTEATVIASGAPEVQVARGSLVQDGDGTRRATLLVQEGTQAEMVLPGGGRQPLPTLTVRATEYTTGPRGPAAMPGPLPPTTAYTYAVELSADEAVAAGAERVTFSRPVLHYVENFLGFPVGGIVPVGFYDRQLAVWLPADNGRVVKVLGVTGDLADLDVTGAGQPSNAAALAALGVTDGERRELARLYQPGQSLWRVPIPHFTPWDCNWPYGPPLDATPPRQPEPEVDEPEDEPCRQGGSVIECQNQVLGESVPVRGTPFTLNYRSDRARGHQAYDRLRVPLSGPTVPASLKRIELRIQIAGRSFEQSFAAAPNQSHLFEWDGRDAYGRELNGRQTATVEIGYVYPAVYQSPANFAQSWAMASGVPITASRGRQDIILWQTSRPVLGMLRRPANDIAGWSLSVHHTYDEAGRFLLLGTGDRRHAAPVGPVISTVAGQTLTGGFSGDGGPATAARLESPEGISVGPDGSVYFADNGNRRIRKIGPDGIIRTVAGTSRSVACAPRCLATQRSLHSPYDVAVAPDGSFYIADYDSVTRVDADGYVSYPWYGRTYGVGVDREGNGYVADYSKGRVLRIGRDGGVTVVAGTGVLGFSGDGGPATQARLNLVGDVDVDSQGNVYISDYFNNRIRRVGTDGIIRTFAGNGQCGPIADGVPALQASLCLDTYVAVGPDDSVYVLDDLRVRRISPSGILTTVAGAGVWGDAGDGGPATAASFRVLGGVAVGPDGTLFISEMQNRRVRRSGLVFPGFSRQPVTVASPDARELYLFDDAGRHLRTSLALTGASLYEFTYDAAGRLASVRDGDGRVTTVARDAAGHPAALVAPFGQRTELTLDAGGHLASVRNPAGETTRFGYDAGGLLTSMTDPRGGVSSFHYDSLGRLIRDEDPAGGFKTLARTIQGDDFRVDLTTAEGQTTRYAVDGLASGDKRWLITLPTSRQQSTLFQGNGTRTATGPDGTVTTLTQGPDPRFGMVSPLASSRQVRLPGGLTSSETLTRSVVLADPSNPLSLTSLQETRTRNGKSWSTAFDGASRRYTITSATGRQSAMTVDAQGRPLTIQAGGLEPIAFSYDPQGRLATIRRGSGADERSALFAYGADGRLSGITDPVSRTVGFEYDEAGRLLRQTMPGGRAVGLSYDDNGNLVSLTPPGRASHAVGYTPVNLQESYAPPPAGTATGSTQYTHDRDRRLTRVSRPGGSAIDLGYDAAGRPATIGLGRGAVTFSYDPASGRVAGISAPGDETLSFTWDGFLLKRATWAGPVAGAVDRVYDSDFRVTSRTVNGAQVASFQYDADGLLTRAGGLTLTRSPLHGLLTGTALGQVATAHTYDGFGDPATFQASFGATPLFSTVYTRDKLGRITRKVETVEGATDTYDYIYDDAARLTGVNRNGLPMARYGYDANGNRTSAAGPLGALDADYDAQDRLLRHGDVTYAYLDSGELSTRTQNGQATRYAYDELGNLLTVELPDGTAIEYQIDGQNRRVGRKVDGVLVRGFLYQDRWKPVAELDGAGNVVSLFIYGDRPNVPESMVKGGVTYRILTDHLGSPRLVVDAASGAIAQRLDYDAFGRVLLDTHPGFQPFGFAGGLYDPQTGLVRFGARDYDAETGRWTAKDPIGFGGRDTNLYGYVQNDPVNFLDPWGLMKLPANPSGLGPEWVLDPSHQHRGGERYRGPNGDILDFHDGKPGAPGDQGRDHWHHYPGGKGPRHRTRMPGDEIPDPGPPPGSGCELTGDEPSGIPFELPEIEPGPLMVGIGVGIIVGTLIEDVLTGGVGIVDDPATLAAGMSLVLGGAR